MTWILIRYRRMGKSFGLRAKLRKYRRNIIYMLIAVDIRMVKIT